MPKSNSNKIFFFLLFIKNFEKQNHFDSTFYDCQFFPPFFHATTGIICNVSLIHTKLDEVLWQAMLLFIMQNRYILFRI